jgi:hypothetical protein
MNPPTKAQAKALLKIWREAGPELERLRREELRKQDYLHALSILTGPLDYNVPPRLPRPTSGLVEQQRLFMKAHKRD